MTKAAAEHEQTEEGTHLLKKYIPERDYENRDFQPYLQSWEDLCGHCELYYDYIHQQGLTEQAFPPECKGHIMDPVLELKPEDFESEEEFDELMMAMDPVTWAAKTFDWHARWYQEEMMSCTAFRKIVRAGRRTGKTTCIALLSTWLTQVNSDFTVLVIAPFEAQVAKVFDEINKFIRKNDEVSQSVKRSTKSPHSIIEFYNGSKIQGFSAGSQSAARSDKVRGQDAHYIVLDEADYLDGDDIQAILAILASHSECGLWASSTPTGAHNKFYEWAVKKDLGFKEFHFVSAESPSWTEKAEHFFKNTYSATMYDHEFLAIFGLQEAGVFRNDLIDMSLVNYDTPTKKENNASRVAMGVDWNGSEIGTHIVIVEARPDKDTIVKYVMLEKYIIKGGDFTQHRAVEEIIRLHDKHKVDFIYVDAGYGEVQVEMLHKIGLANPKSGLHRKVKSYTMQSKIEIKDPLNGSMIKKAAKPFLVNSAARELEAGRIVLPHSEDTQVLVESTEGADTGEVHGLVQQMRNFKVERISASGLPTYSQGEDHTLTAWMLCIMAFLLEMSDLRKQRADAHVRPVRPIGKEKPKDDEHTNARMGEAVRQLDQGMSELQKQSVGKRVTSVFKSQPYAAAHKRAISQGDKTAIRSHFSRNKINRHSSFTNKRGSRGF